MMSICFLDKGVAQVWAGRAVVSFIHACDIGVRRCQHCLKQMLASGRTISSDLCDVH